MASPMSARPLVAEFTGTALLLAAVVGSGIMGEQLAAGNAAIALLANAIATGAMLTVLILMFASTSGAHFNPAVTLAMWLRGETPFRQMLPYWLVQVAGALAGTWLAHAMFDLDLMQASTHARTGVGQWLAEFTATFGLVATILLVSARRPDSVALAVGLYITAGYWFTASTSFANPAVTIARAFTDTFSGIEPQHVAGFIAAQLAGAVTATVFCRWLAFTGTTEAR
jgi:glycerol uptake facilitator-like aquaporin